MFEEIIDHNDDINRLLEKGYAIAFDSGYLIVRDIPYLDERGELKSAAFVTKLVFEDEVRVRQEDHQIFFTGSIPHGISGKPIPNLGGGPYTLSLGEESLDVVIQRVFSNKPKVNGNLVNHKDFFEKIESYVGIISGPAMEKHGANPLTFRAVKKFNPDSVFKFHDTLSSRAEILDLSKKLKDDVVAVIGLGGTGAYLLDFLIKTPVKEIRAFDSDEFHIHNSYRSPGSLDPDEFRKKKVEIYKDRYENFRTGLSFHSKFIDVSSGDDLEGVTFAFVCVDKGSSRAGIFELLISKNIPFVDVGMGLSRRDGSLNGMLRTTYFSKEEAGKTRDKGLAELQDRSENLYRTNIQISELNALNASLAILKFKQIRGFYFTDASYYNLLFEIGDFKIVTNSKDEEN